MDDKTLHNFLSKVNPNGPTLPGMDSPCWLWIPGCIDVSGSIVVDRVQVPAHRLIWAHVNTAPPDFDKRYVRRLCKSRACVNPEHLYLPEVRGPYKRKRKVKPKEHAVPRNSHRYRAGVREDRRTAYKIHEEHGIPIKETMETLTLARAEENRLRPKRGPVCRQVEPGTAVSHTKGMNKAVLTQLRARNWSERRVDATRVLGTLLRTYGLKVLDNPWDVPAYHQWRYEILQALRYRRRVERERPRHDIPLMYDLEVVLMILQKSTSHQASAMLHTPGQRQTWREERLAREGVPE